MDGIKAYRIRSDFWAPDPNDVHLGISRDSELVDDEDLTHEYWIEHANFMRGFGSEHVYNQGWREKQIAEHRAIKSIQDAAASLIKPLRQGLTKLGCVIHDRDEVYLILSSELPVEEIKTAGDDEANVGSWLFQRTARHGWQSEKVVHVYAWAEEVSLEAAFEALSEATFDGDPDPWGTQTTTSLLPRATETLEKWARRVAVPVDAVDRIITRLREYDDVELAFATPSAAAKSCPEMVAGMFPLGSTSMIAAASGTGKSSLAHMLAHVASAPLGAGEAREFLGQPIERQFQAVFITVEEPDDAFAYRRDRFERRWPGADVTFLSITRDRLPEVLAMLRRHASTRNGSSPGVVFLDSVRGCIEGDDTKTHVATDFHQPLTDFARSTGWALVLLHHTTKQPSRSLAQFRASISGSEAHIGFPRIVYGMIDRGSGLVEFGPVKSNVPAEFLAFKLGESILYRHNEQSWVIEPLASDDGGARPASGDHVERICAAIADMNRCQRVVRMSGKDGLWEQRLPSLAGMGRTFIQQAVKSLIETRRIINDAVAGLLINDPEYAAARGSLGNP